MKLSMQILADSLSRFGVRAGGDVSDVMELVGVRLLTEDTQVLRQYVYITGNGAKAKGAGSYIFIGGGMKSTANALFLPEETTLFAALSWVLEAFEFYVRWDNDLQGILNRDSRLKDLLNISLPVFKNPMFVHDPEFYLLAMAGQQPQNSDWVYEESSGRYIFSNDLINLYKVDSRYMESLAMRRAAIFPEVIREYPILIYNLWRGERYAGRICVNATQSAVTPGQLQLIEHLGQSVLIAISRRTEHGNHSARALEIVLSNLIDKKEIEREETIRHLSSYGWKADDRYVCIKIDVHERDVYIMSLIAACNRLESLIGGSFAFPFQKSIFVLINLTCGEQSLDDCLARLGGFWREGLFKSGVSNTFCDFFMAGEHYLQAKAALEIGTLYDEMIWSYRFEDYALPYFFRRAASEMPPELLCSRHVMALLEYDRKKRTRLCETLDAFIANDRNATETARALFIHRSTLLYRLDRIKSITGLDLDNEPLRFHAQLSLKLLRDCEKRSPNVSC